MAARQSIIDRMTHRDIQMYEAMPHMMDTLDGRLGEQTSAIHATSAENKKANSTLNVAEAWLNTNGKPFSAQHVQAQG